MRALSDKSWLGNYLTSGVANEIMRGLRELVAYHTIVPTRAFHQLPSEE